MPSPGQRCLYPNLWDIRICYFIWQSGSKDAGGIKIVNQMTLNWRISLDYPVGPNVVTWALNCGRRRQKKENQRDDTIRTQPTVASFGGGERTQGRQMAFRSWERQGNRFCTRASRMNTALPTPSFYPSGILTSRTERKLIGTTVHVICFSSNTKLI